MVPSIGRVVLFRSRTGRYTVPAIITATTSTLAQAGVDVWLASGGERGVPPLSSDLHVHLTVLTPGVPGQRASANDFVEPSDHPVQENVGGVYQEWDVPPTGGDGSLMVGREHEAGSWAWPERL